MESYHPIHFSARLEPGPDAARTQKLEIVQSKDFEWEISPMGSRFHLLFRNCVKEINGDAYVHRWDSQLPFLHSENWSKKLRYNNEFCKLWHVIQYIFFFSRRPNQKFSASDWDLTFTFLFMHWLLHYFFSLDRDVAGNNIRYLLWIIISSRWHSAPFNRTRVKPYLSIP